MIYDDLQRELAALGISKPKPRVTISQILMLRRRGMSDKEIGREVGLSTKEIERRRRQAVVADYSAGLPLAQIANRHHVQVGNITRSVRQAGASLRADRLTDEALLDLYQQRGRFPGPGGRRYAKLRRAGLPLVTEKIEPPPRDELEDALEHWGELGVAQEYHVTVKHVQRWRAHYGLGEDQ